MFRSIFVILATAVFASVEQTLLIKNLPVDFKESDIENALSQHGFRPGSDFDYIYSVTLLYTRLPAKLFEPKNFASKTGQGFAFINFRDHSTALRAKDTLTTIEFSKCKMKPLEALWVSAQIILNLTF